MKHFICSIPSHDFAPDWEQECDAENFEEACVKFARMAGGFAEDEDGNPIESDWGPEDIKRFVYEEEIPVEYHNDGVV